MALRGPLYTVLAKEKDLDLCPDLAKAWCAFPWTMRNDGNIHSCSFGAGIDAGHGFNVVPLSGSGHPRSVRRYSHTLLESRGENTDSLLDPG